MQKLQAEVAQLDLKLAAVNEVLVEATEARENERYVAHLNSYKSECIPYFAVPPPSKLQQHTYSLRKFHTGGG